MIRRLGFWSDEMLGDGLEALMEWDLPRGRWVLHTCRELGNLTDRWLDLQSSSSGEFDSRLLGLDVVGDADRSPHWLVAGDRADLSLALRGVLRTRGASSALLARPLRGSPPSVIHAHYGPLAASQLPLARRLGAPLVASFYGYDATEARFVDSSRWRRAYRRLFHACSALVVEGPYMGRRLVSLGCPEEKIDVVRLPADEASLAAIPKPAAADAFRVVIAGRFAEKKGFDVGIEAFARALRGRGDAELLIIGGGELEGEYRQLVDRAGIGDQVSWAGRLPFTRFMASLAGAAVGLYPSRTAPNGDSEGGAPVTLIEAQWLGVPAIVSDHDDLPFVVPPDDSIVLRAEAVDDWSDALLGLYEDRARLRRMSEAARAFARAEHSLGANVRAREAIYDAVA